MRSVLLDLVVGLQVPVSGVLEVGREQRTYVGGVPEHERSEQERRFEELDLGGFFWSFVRLQARVDDLEEQVRELRESR